MGNEFINSGWEYNGTDQLDTGISIGPASLSKTKGTLYLKSDFNEDIAFSFDAGGAGVGMSPSPIDISATTKDVDSWGVVFANPAFRKTLSPADFSGACLIQSYTAALPVPGVGGSGGGIFFDVDKGIITSLIATFASGGVLALGAHATIIASCSAMVACAGLVATTPQAGAAVMIGYVRLKEGRRGSEILCSYPWKVTTNGQNYSYIFHEDGRCYWYEYKSVQISPNGKGSWRVVKDSKEEDAKRSVEITWESGSKEIWKLPVSLTAQTGTWQTKEKKGSSLTAKYDLTKMTLIHKTLKS